MARNEQLIRQHKILQILERVRFGKTLEELQSDVVEELGLKSIHSRTLRRDIDALQAAGIDLDVHDTPRGKVWKLGPMAKSPTKISFSSSELISLYLGRQLLHPLAGTPFWQGIETFWKKIQDEVPESVLKHYSLYRRTLGVMGIPAKSYEEKQGIIKTINRAIIKNRVVEIDYEAPAKPKKTRRIEPHRMVLFQSSLYVICTACEVKEPESRIRSLKIDRMSRAVITDDYFKQPAEDELDQFIGQNIGMFVGKKKPSDFRIRVSSRAARWLVEDPVHPEQKIKQLDDGSMELTVQAVHEMEIIPRVLSMGIEAEILAPPHARRRMTEMVREMARKYDE